MLQTDLARGTAWGIVPEKFDELIRQAAQLKLSPDQLAALERSTAGRPAPKPYTVMENGVAIITISGPLVKRAGIFARLMGAQTYGDIQSALQSALADPEVRGLVLDVDSPGGTVNGAEETASMVHQARSSKPVAAVSSGMMASAAYWIGSAAGRVFVGRTADVGSIGVLMVHTDWSKFDEKAGIKTTYLTAGKYKALGNDAEPLSDEARKEFQGQLDQIYDVFIGAVGRYRNVPAVQVRNTMADGRIFIGERAVAVGLADQIGGLQDAISYITSRQKQNTSLKGSQTMTKSYQPATLETVLKVQGISREEHERRKAAATAARQPVDFTKPAGSPAQTASAPAASGQDRDYFAMVRRLRAETGCTATEAMRRVNKERPDLWAKMLSEANGGRDFSSRIGK
jgi:signal peptide peptidase SppA